VASATGSAAAATLPVRRAVPGRSGFGFAVPALALLLLFFALPVLFLLLRSVLEPQPGLSNYAQLFGSSTYLRVLGNTFLVSAVVTAAALLIGFPVAWLLAVLPGRWSAVLFGIVLLSMWTNLLARTYAWMVLLQRTGAVNKLLIGMGLIDRPLPLVNNLVGVTIGMTYIMLPFVILPLHATLRGIDPAIFQAASLCGAGRWQAFRRVLLPLALPGVAAGGLMVFVMSLGYFVTPALLGGTANMMLAELIAQLVQSLLNWGLGGAAAFVLLVVTLAIYALQLRYLGGRGATMLGGR
jgi:putative spermidine/putrescine transport system permease protein